MTELKPCPFCPEPPKMDCGDDGTGGEFAYCRRCGIFKRPSEWNSRPIEDRLRAALEEIQKICNSGSLHKLMEIRGALEALQ